MASGQGPGNVQYNYSDLMGIWIKAGGNPQAAWMAAAIAEAESSGNTMDYDIDSNGSIDRGLWQINSVHGTQSTYDVMGNARAAVSVSNNGKNWTPWVTYNNGAESVDYSARPNMSVAINATSAAQNQWAAQQAQQLALGNYSAAGSAPQGGGGGGGTSTNAPSGGGGGFDWNPFSWPGKILSGGEHVIGGVVSGVAKGAVDYTAKTILGPFMTLVAGVLGIASGLTLVILGLMVIASQTKAGRAVGQAGMAAVAPETVASTEYQQAGRTTATVTQRRRQAVRLGGFQFRPGRVNTTVNRPPTVTEALRDEARKNSIPQPAAPRSVRGRRPYQNPEYPPAGAGPQRGARSYGR